MTKEQFDAALGEYSIRSYNEQRIGAITREKLIEEIYKKYA